MRDGKKSQKLRKKPSTHLADVGIYTSKAARPSARAIAGNLASKYTPSQQATRVAHKRGSQPSRDL